MATLWKRVHERAWKKSWDALGMGTASGAVIAFGIAVVGVVAVWAIGGSGQVESSILDRIGWSVAILAMFPLVYAWHFVTAPYEMVREVEARLLATGAQPVAFQEWDRVKALTLWQVACLWAGVEPVWPVPPGTPSARLSLIQNAIIARRLRVVLKDGMAGSLQKLSLGYGDENGFLGETPPHEPQERVARAELERFFSERKEFPEFLFPERRNAIAKI